MTSFSSENLPRLLTTSEACEFLWNKTGRTYAARLYRAAQDERIKSKRISGRHWWPLVNLKMLAEELADE